MSKSTGFIFASLRTPPWVGWLGGAWMVVLTSCVSPTPVTPTPTPLPLQQPSPTHTALPANVAEIVQALILDERAASIAGDADTLADLWTADAVIMDGRATADPADDYIWRGRAAILDRYRLAVFPAPPPSLALDDLATAVIEVTGDQATVRFGVDRWRMAQSDGRWRLLELRYN